MPDTDKMIPEVYAYATFKQNFVEQTGAFPSDETLATLVLASAVRQCAQSIGLLAQVAAGAATAPPPQQYVNGVPILGGKG